MFSTTDENFFKIEAWVSESGKRARILGKPGCLGRIREGKTAKTGPLFVQLNGKTRQTLLPGFAAKAGSRPIGKAGSDAIEFKQTVFK